MSRDDKSGKYIDLKINGKLFPSWINLNFKKYKLDDIFNKSSDDPCNIKDASKEYKLELRKYQAFIGQFLDFRSPYRNALLYHFVGSGKSGSVINIYNVLYNYTPGWNVFLLIKASLKGGWLDEIKLWLKKDEYEYRYRNIVFIHYDSPFADRSFMDAMKNVDSSKKSLYIIDEVHNFIRNVYSNISSDGGKRAQRIYDYIIQDQKENPDTRVVCMSATPAVNSPFELALLFNLLRPGIFPKSEAEFNNLFISTTTHQTLNLNTKNMFQRRIMGLVSFYIGATPDLYATKSIRYVDVPMSEYQKDVYSYFDEIERKLALKSGPIKGGSQVYKVYTRQACNFVFPAISQKVTGEGRPRPGKFRLSEKDANKLAESGKVKSKDKGKLVHLNEYLQAVENYITTFTDYLSQKDKEDRNNKYTIMDDIKKFISYQGEYDKFHEEKIPKSNLYQAMYTSSPKMTNIIFNIMRSKGPVIVYSNYVLMEGIEIFKIYLHFLGFYNYMKEKKLLNGQIGYTEFHGGIKDIDERFAGMRIYNMPENKLGNLIKIMLISPAGAEGLSLKNVRQIHIMEPYWNEVRITQMIGRGIRQCSHKDLPLEERHVDIYRYKSILPDRKKQTTDEYIEDVARGKDGLIQSFLDAVKEVAIDCTLFKPHNMMAQEYKCFQFEEPSLFDQNIGPAYRTDIADDMKIDNGSNSTKTKTIRIKVMKVKAVKITSTPDAESVTYSKPENYWLYLESGVVYDYDLHFAVGRVARDENGILMKLDKDTYIIDYVIPIPEITDV
ncbi:DEAD/SNF2-like helicase [Indivirus ILV1]|uniref:DEAD/SNF2-like helicase n=1 Tax=Indivirus ILV1 TaxID=1977633 RepID=A0A1V0SDK4_9VIRU|nr:DEAD/SNF2-like helicase [Indivirus ILV1]